jgi:hypothetical protein
MVDNHADPFFHMTGDPLRSGVFFPGTLPRPDSFRTFDPVEKSPER